MVNIVMPDSDTVNIIASNKDILIGLITVIITIYIPVGILFLTKLNEEGAFKLLDEYIVSKKIFNVKKTLFYCVIYFVILFVVSILNNLEAKTYISIIFILLMVIIWKLLIGIIKLYGWYSPKTKKNIREKELSQSDDLNVWENVFSGKDINYEEAYFIMKSFFNVVDSTKDRVKRSNLLQIYFNIDKLEEYNKLFIGYGFSTFVKLLDLYYNVWTIEQYQEEDINNYGRESDLIRKIIKKHFSEINDGEEYSIIRTIRKHINEFSSVELYRDSLLKYLLLIILESKNLLLNMDFLPQLVKLIPEYQIKMDNYFNPDRIYIFNVLINWFLDNIRIEQKEYEHSIDRVIDYFFPGIDIICFSTILNFLFLPYDPNGNRVMNFSEHKFNFGHISRFHMFGGEDSEDALEKTTQNEEDYTIMFLLKMFDFNQIDIDKYLSECEIVLSSGDVDGIKISRIKRLQYYLKKIKYQDSQNHL